MVKNKKKELLKKLSPDDEPKDFADFWKINYKKGSSIFNHKISIGVKF